VIVTKSDVKKSDSYKYNFL